MIVGGLHLYFPPNLHFTCLRSSHRGVLCKKGVLKNSTNFTGKHVFWSLLDLRSTTLFKKMLQHRFYPVKLAKVFRTPILKNIANDCFCCLIGLLNSGNISIYILALALQKSHKKYLKYPLSLKLYIKLINNNH